MADVGVCTSPGYSMRLSPMVSLVLCFQLFADDSPQQNGHRARPVLSSTMALAQSSQLANAVAAL
eukprot:14707147-Ditylum_brightwellii.AAC.1